MPTPRKTAWGNAWKGEGIKRRQAPAVWTSWGSWVQPGELGQCHGDNLGRGPLDLPRDPCVALAGFRVSALSPSGVVALYRCGSASQGVTHVDAT